jgi:outer membrane protein OmpA-like peptidoglycan-associated protein
VPKPPSTTDERKRVVEGLIADRARAEYTDQGGRQEPVTVRPLTETASTPADVAARGAPPRPQAAPTESVTRLAEAPSPPAEPVPPRTTALAERLGAAPPPAPPAEMPSAAMPAPPAAVTPPAPSSITYAPTMATPVRPLIPALGQIASYGDETIVVDSSGVRGGSRVLAPSQQVAGLPRAGFDPGNASVSSEVGRISFAPGSTTLSAEAKAMLADIARLRAQVDGALRIVGRGDQAAARAAAISRELRRLGVPAARLYDGGADGTLLGDEADIYLDY